MGVRLRAGDLPHSSSRLPTPLLSVGAWLHRCPLVLRRLPCPRAPSPIVRRRLLRPPLRWGGASGVSDKDRYYRLWAAVRAAIEVGAFVGGFIHAAAAPMQTV